MYQLPYYQEFADYYNYSAEDIAAYGFSVAKSQWAGSGYMALTGITFLVYARILTVKNDFIFLHKKRCEIIDYLF
jgi:hypothetical protein